MDREDNAGRGAGRDGVGRGIGRGGRRGGRGPRRHLENPRLIRILYTPSENFSTSTFPPVIYEFPLVASCVLWRFELNRVLHHIHLINEQEEPTADMYRLWLEHVYAFRVSWTTRFVPTDVQACVNFVEATIGVSVTDWAVERG